MPHLETTGTAYFAVPFIPGRLVSFRAASPAKQAVGIYPYGSVLASSEAFTLLASTAALFAAPCSVLVASVF